MQRVGFENVFSAGAGGDGQFLVAVIEDLLREIQPAPFLHVLTEGRGGAVCADYDFRMYRGFAAGLFVAETRSAGGPIHSDTALAEVNLYALGFRRTHQRDVQVRA